MTDIRVLLLLLCATTANATASVTTGLTHLVPFPSRDNATLRIGYAAPLTTVLKLSCAIYPLQSRSAIWNKTWSINADSTGETSVVATPSKRPEPWDLQQPQLYTVNCSASATEEVVDDDDRWSRPPPPPPPLPQSHLAVRFGFRSFAAVDGRFLLNGRPIFLRGNSINPPGRDLPPVSGTKQFALSYLRWMKQNTHINAVRIGDGVSSSTAPWYDAADEVGMLIYAGPYSNPACPGCRAKPADSPVPADSVQAAVADYEKVIRGVAPHPSHVILILSNENDISGAHGHWGYSPYAHEYAELLRNVSMRLKEYDPSRVYLADAGFGHGFGGEVMDDHTYFGWYRGDAVDYFQERRAVYGPRAESQPFTFTECIGSYLTAAGDTDVGGKNYAWSLKWTGHAPQGEGRGNRHAVHTAKGSIEIVRRFRPHNPNLAGIMPFEAPFYYCGDNVTAFSDLPTRDPERGFFGPSAVQMQEKTSFAPVLLSIELWTPHRYTSDALRFTAHVVNDADDGSALPASTLHWSLTPTAESCRPRRCAEAAGALQGTVPVAAVEYYSTASMAVEIELTGSSPGEYTLWAELRAAGASVNESVIASNEEHVELFPPRSTGLSLGSGGGGGGGHESTAPVLLYEPLGTQTAQALRNVGVSSERVDAAELKQALQREEAAAAAAAANATTVVVIGEDSWDQALESLSAELHSYVDQAAGRVVLLQQSNAPLNLSLAWAPGGAALQLYPTDQYIMHSGLTVSRGRPVHPTRMQHPVFNEPNALTREQFLSWSEASNWTEAAVDTVAQQRATPNQSPAALGVFMKMMKMINSTNGTAEIASNEAALNRVDVLIAHAMGLQNIVLADLAGRNGGGVLFCGLGLVERAGSEPVADGLLENLLAYYTRRESVASIDGSSTSVTSGSSTIAAKSAKLSAPGPGGVRDLHPMIESGHTVIWGNYSSERGLVRTDVNGLILRPCSYDSSCSMNGLGNVPCGRTVLGPYTWTYMGHNLDLAPEAKAGSGVVWLRSNATTVTTVFDAAPLAPSGHGHHPAPPAPAAPSMGVDVLDARTLELSSSMECTAEGSAQEGWRVVCSLPAQGGAEEVDEASPALDGGAVSTVALRFKAAKTLVLRSSVFSTTTRGPPGR